MTIPEPSVPGVAVLSGRYELEQAIGHGGMADVYRGRDLRMGRPVAVKILRDVTADPAARERFTVEAQTLAGLSHPGLVTVLDAGIDGHRPYLVMELVEGPTLHQAARHGGLPAAELAGIGAQVAEALAYVHRRGIVHRDVKPANVLLSNDGRVLLADFGVAKLTERAAALTATGSTVGTAAYLAPEQLRGGPVGPAADVYSFGLVLLEALTGRPAYPGVAIEAAVVRLTRAPAIPETAPPALSELLRRMVSLDPADRPALTEVASVLRTVRAGDGTDDTILLPAAERPVRGYGTAVLPAPVMPGRQPLQTPAGSRPAFRRPVIVAAVLVVATVLALAMALLLARDASRGESSIPPTVPAEISQELRDLHEAVNG